MANVGNGPTGTVLTGNGVSSPPTWQTGGSHFLNTLTGNTGTATPTAGNINITTGAANANGTAKFTGSGSNVTLTFDTATSNGQIGIGSNSLSSLTSGTVNTCIGTNSGKSITSGQANLGLGNGAFSSLTTGSFNISLEAQDKLTTGSYNTLLGYGSADNYTGAESSNILIGCNVFGTASESGVCRIGRPDNVHPGQITSTYIAGITGVSPTSGNTPQVVLCDNAGQLTTISSSTSGYVLTSNGSATPTFQAASGGITTIDGNSGSVTGSTITITTGTSNANGTSKFTGSGTTITQTFSSTDGNFNLGLGQATLGALTSGANNVALGVSTLNMATSGSENIGVGSGLFHLVTGNYNTALGYNALSNTTASANTAVGAYALNNLVGGVENVAIGTFNTYTTGVGFNYTGSESSNILIMNAGVLGESNVMRLGTSGSGAGQVNETYIAGIVGNTVSNAEMVTINSSTGQLGVASIPTGPSVAFEANLSTTQSNATGNGVVYTIVFDSIVHQTGTAYNNSTGTFTAPTTGFYHFSLITTLTNLGAGNGAFYNAIVPSSGPSISAFNVPLTIASGGYVSSQVSFTLYLAANATVTCTAQVGAGSQTVGIYGASSGGTTFSGFSVGF